jgi:hypothetical protein
VQLSLNLLEAPPRPELAVWEQLSEEERQAVVVQLAGLILTAALGAADQESDDA